LFITTESLGVDSPVFIKLEWLILSWDASDMKRKFTIIVLSLISIIVFIPITHSDDSEKWFLMARHGECAEIKSLERKIPDIEGINDPESFSKLMKEKGNEVITNEPKELQGKAVEVNVPKEGLSLMFVVESICKEFVDRK